MDRSRSYTLRIIVVSIFFLAAGFIVGFYSMRFFPKSRRDMAADAVMIKRMRAIQRARHEGVSEYKFTVAAPNPILRKY